MKDKRTYDKLKEHGEDMTHENESKITIDPNYKKEDRKVLIDLTFYRTIQSRFTRLQRT
jgi:predicted metalloprotease